MQAFQVVLKKTPCIGSGICMSGTCVYPLCRKAPAPAKNTTEAKIDVRNQNGKDTMVTSSSCEIL
jgi:hypothetical protein